MRTKINLILIVLIAFSINLTSSENEKITYNGYDTALMSILWMQHSAEYHALCYQAYNTAKLMLEKMEEVDFEKPRSIVLDIDETVLNNMPYNAKKINAYGKEKISFYDWADLAIAETIPGVKDFLDFAQQKGYEIFYISNRRDKVLKSTIENLKKYDLPFADSSHVLLKKDNQSKKSRREIVEENFEICLLVGDNILDFKEFGDSNEIRRDKVKENQELFGSKYIILPNPVHGSWEKAFYNSGKYIPIDERNVIKKKLLKDY